MAEYLDEIIGLSLLDDRMTYILCYLLVIWIAYQAFTFLYHLFKVN